jgi:hypothetical protein
MLVTGLPREFELLFSKRVVIITGFPGFAGLGIAFISFRLILRVDVAPRLFGLLVVLPVPSLSKLELKSEFVCLYRCGLLKLGGTSFMGLPSRKLLALEAQSCSPPQFTQGAPNALRDKLAWITIMDTKTRRITDFFITSPLSYHPISAKFFLLEWFTPMKIFFAFFLPLSVLNYISFTPKRKYNE